jgi:hypothetical protein
VQVTPGLAVGIYTLVVLAGIGGMKVVMTTSLVGDAVRLRAAA